MKINRKMMQRAEDAWSVLCSLYGERYAPALMKVRGACNPRVATLAKALGKSRAAAKAALVYRELSSLNGGYIKLMMACHNDGSIQKIISQAGGKFSAWEIDTAQRVLCAAIDARKEDIL